mgnify:CR=1 FL=1
MKKFILDEIDHQILDILIENARTPFTDIAKKLLVSAGTIHVRVKKMEDEGIIQGSTLTLNYEKMGYSFLQRGDPKTCRRIDQINAATTAADNSAVVICASKLYNLTAKSSQGIPLEVISSL